MKKTQIFLNQSNNEQFVATHHLAPNNNKILSNQDTNKQSVESNTPAVTISQISLDFIEWFIGFVDGEGNFSIKRDYNTFAFIFQIKLHIDDVNILHFIKSNLKMGNVRSYPLFGVLEISKKRDVQLLIDIFLIIL